MTTSPDPDPDAEADAAAFGGWPLDEGAGGEVVKARSLNLPKSTESCLASLNGHT